MITNQKTIDCSINSPCQNLSKCTENSTEYMNTDWLLRVNGNSAYYIISYEAIFTLTFRIRCDSF